MKLMCIVVFMCLSCPVKTEAQSNETYKGKGFSLEYPKEWKTTNEEGILNFFPADDSAAITISTYPNINLSIAELKNAIVEVTSKDAGGIDSVKVISTANPIILYYECISNNIKWVAKIFQRKNELFFLTVNGSPATWIQRKDLFMKVMDSFKLD